MPGKLEAEFDSYAAEFAEAGIAFDPDYRAEIRDAFFCGALSALYLLGETPHRELVREIEVFKRDREEDADIHRRRN